MRVQRYCECILNTVAAYPMSRVSIYSAADVALCNDYNIIQIVVQINSTIV